ncbi:hypothetical protein ACF0H5_020669 [Mactra antiquata]
MKEKPVERMEYPETPPWTMFFDGPLYQKYDEFMKNKDFSKILLNTKLRLANSTNSGGDIVSSTFSTDDDRWDKDVDDPSGSTYQYVSPDYYKRAHNEEKRRTRRTRAFILLGILVMAALAFGSALVIHYFFVPSAEERNPANTVNVSFAINTTDEFPADEAETTTSAVDDELVNMLDAISKAGHPHEHDHENILNPDGKIFDETFQPIDVTTGDTTDVSGSDEKHKTSTTLEPETKRPESTTNTQQSSSFTEGAMYELHLIPDTSSGDVRIGSDTTPTKSLEMNVTTTARSKILDSISAKPVSSTNEFDPMDFFAMDDFLLIDNSSSTTESYLDNLFLLPTDTTTSKAETTLPPLTTSRRSSTVLEAQTTNATKTIETVRDVIATSDATTKDANTKDFFALFDTTDVTTFSDVTTSSETFSTPTSTAVDSTTNINVLQTTLVETSTTPEWSSEVTSSLSAEITTTMSSEMTTSYGRETTQHTDSSSLIMNATTTQYTPPPKNNELKISTILNEAVNEPTNAKTDGQVADTPNHLAQQAPTTTTKIIAEYLPTDVPTSVTSVNPTQEPTNNNELVDTTINKRTNEETSTNDTNDTKLIETTETMETRHSSTLETKTTTTTTTTTTTLPPDISVLSMEDRTSYLYENTTIDCTVKHALRWETLSIRVQKKWRPLEITLHPSGSIEFSKSLKQRQDVTYDIKDNAAGNGNDISLSLVISKVQCKDAETFICTLKSAYPDKVTQSQLVVVGKPSNAIQLTMGPSTIENKALRITASWQGGYPVPWTNMSWTAIDANNKSYNLEKYGEYRDRELHEDHYFCQTTLSHSIVIFPKLHLNGTRIVVKPDIHGKQYFVDKEMEQYLLDVKPGEDEILVIPKDYCGTVIKEKSIAHPYTPCYKFVRCLPGDLVVQLCPTEFIQFQVAFVRIDITPNKRITRQQPTS